MAVAVDGVPGGCRNLVGAREASRLMRRGCWRGPPEPAGRALEIGDPLLDVSVSTVVGINLHHLAAPVRRRRRQTPLGEPVRDRCSRVLRDGIDGSPDLLVLPGSHGETRRRA
jgi:hypothetical protein